MFNRFAARALPRGMAGVTAKRFLRPNQAALGRLASIQTSVRYMSENPKHITNPVMFCRQCEQTQDHYACTTVGVCGKTAETSALQDTLIHQVKSIALWAVAARAAGASAEELFNANHWTLSSVFSTLTNVNFSEERIAAYIRNGCEIKKELQDLVGAKGGTAPAGPIADLDLTGLSPEELETFSHSVSVPTRQAQMGDADCFSLTEMATYGSKGVCAYAAHCHQLGRIDEDIMKGIHEVFAKLSETEPDMNGFLANALRVGEINTSVMAMLDDAHATTFGAPEPTQVKMTATEGKCILVSGHDMVDLEALLKQTEGTGVNVYTHGEMLPAHGYPGLKKYAHLVGNYGTAWQNQKFEFASFPGPVVVTTNCVMEPRRIYKNRLYTMNEVGLDGVKHIGSDRDFSEVIEQAQSMKGFKKTAEPPEYHTVGFNHRAVLPLAGQVIEAAQSGAISRIVLIGGCDGSQFERK